AVTGRAEPAIFFAAGAPFPFAERSGAENHGCAVAGIFSAAQITAVVEALDTLWNGHPAQTEQRRHHVLGIDRRIKRTRLGAQALWPADEHRHADRFVEWLLFLEHSLRTQHVAVIGAEDQDCVLSQACVAQR